MLADKARANLPLASTCGGGRHSNMRIIAANTAVRASESAIGTQFLILSSIVLGPLHAYIKIYYKYTVELHSIHQNHSFESNRKGWRGMYGSGESSVDNWTRESVRSLTADFSPIDFSPIDFLSHPVYPGSVSE